MQNNSYDSIIVGSGAGGSAAAYRLAVGDRRVLVVEKGHELSTDGSTLDIDQVVRLGKFKSQETWNDSCGNRLTPEEYFNLGGKTKWYGATLARFSPEEFKGDSQRGFLPWPIRYADLDPFYSEAERLLGVRNFDCEPDLSWIVDRLERIGNWQHQSLPLGLHASILDYPDEARHFDGFASVRRLKSDGESSFLRKVSGLPNIKIITGHAAKVLLADIGDRRRIVGVVLDDGSEYRAHNVVLAAGALHSPRLLQKYLEDADLAAELPAYASVGGNLKMHLLTALLAISPGRKTDVLRKTTLLINERYPHSTVQPLGFDGELISTLIPRLVPRKLARALAERAYGFFLQTEDGSDARNRVFAGDESTGKLPVLDYNPGRHNTTLREHLRLVAGLRGDLARAGMIGLSQRIGLSGTAHVCGTLVAGNDPRSSVVDPSGRVHGLQGLYVADGSVLPRSSRVNPALTIYAWALRVADGMLHSLRAAA